MKTIVSLICDQCGGTFEREKRFDQRYDKRQGKRYLGRFCSLKCKGLANTTAIEVSCAECHSTFFRIPGEIKRSTTGRFFCGKSCAATYNNRIKKKSRRSSCEEKLLLLLRERFPEIQFIPNDKDMLDGFEVDIAVPSLEMAIEWNGIVHFRPIYGKHKLSKIQKRDAEKEQRAIEKKIDLIVIPDLVSTDAVIKQAFNDISSIINGILESS